MMQNPTRNPKKSFALNKALVLYQFPLDLKNAANSLFDTLFTKFYRKILKNPWNQESFDISELVNKLNEILNYIWISSLDP